MKPTKTTLRQRIEDIYQIKLDGAAFVDIRRYVAEKEAAGEAPWTIPEGGKPTSERTLWRYSQQADALIAQSCKEGRKRAMRRHLAQRRALYARCVETKEYSTALRVLHDEAELRGLYPRPEDEVLREVAGMKRQLDEMDNRHDSTGYHPSGNGQTSPGDPGTGGADRPTAGAPPG
jgi:hypothetical protein